MNNIASIWKACNKCGWTSIPTNKTDECLNCAEIEKKTIIFKPNTWLQNRLRTVETLKERGIYG